MTIGGAGSGALEAPSRGERGDAASGVHAQPRLETAELDILGMTCAACVGRVERGLSGVEGVVEASVNLPMERATVRFDPARVDASALAAAVEATGYSVAGAAPAKAGGGAQSASEVRDAAAAREHAALRRDVIVAAVLTVPLLVLGMSHGLLPGADGPLGRALQLVLASIVVFGPGRRFFTLAWNAARHRTTDMNTLVAIGAGAAFAYSAVAVLAPQLFPHAEHGVLPHVYFEAAGAIISFILLGKLLEARARKRLVDAVKGLIALRPQTAWRIEGDSEREVPIESLARGAPQAAPRRVRHVRDARVHGLHLCASRGGLSRGRRCRSRRRPRSRARAWRIQAAGFGVALGGCDCGSEQRLSSVHDR